MAKGQEVIITKHGRPVARLVPENNADKVEIESVIKEIKALRKNLTLDGLDLKTMREEGRR